MEKIFNIEEERFLEPMTELIYNDIIKKIIADANIGNDRNDKKTTIIGLNYYGAIFASVLGFKYSIPFTYYFYNKNRIDELENELHEINSKKIIIITDVIVYGNSLKNLIDILNKNNLINSNTSIEIITIFERKNKEIGTSKIYFAPQVDSIYILNDTFDIEICDKNKDTCIFYNINNDGCNKFEDY